MRKLLLLFSWRRRSPPDNSAADGPGDGTIPAANPFARDRAHCRDLHGKPQLRPCLRLCSRARRDRLGQMPAGRRGRRAASRNFPCRPSRRRPKRPTRPFLIDAQPDAGSEDRSGPRLLCRAGADRRRTMDRFVEASNAGAAVMGYRDGHKLAQWRLAKEFTLADHFFHAAFGGSLLNHFFLVCACAPTFPDAPAALVADARRAGTPAARGRIRPRACSTGPPTGVHSGKVDARRFRDCGTLAPSRRPGRRQRVNDGPAGADSAHDRRPAHREGRRLGLVRGRLGRRRRGPVRSPTPTPSGSRPITSPFFISPVMGRAPPGARRISGTNKTFSPPPPRGTLPQVSFYKPVGRVNEHPAYAEFEAGDAHLGGSH